MFLMSVTTFCISVIIYLSSILDRFFHNTWHCFSHSSVNNMAIVAAAVQRGVDLDPYASHLSAGEKFVLRGMESLGVVF
jgi:hypothetical protein